MPKEMTKQDRIKAEFRRLKRNYAGSPKPLLDIATPLMENAAWMKATLEDLAQETDANGATESYVNGANQSGNKTSSALNAYNSTVKNYATVMERLARMLTVTAGKSKLDRIMADDD